MRNRCYFPILLFVIVGLLSCDSLDDNPVFDGQSLATQLEGREVFIDNVIACAASGENRDTVSVFLYPRPGVENIRYFETFSAEVDKNDFGAYTEVTLDLIDVFNGYLLKFELVPIREKWVIVSFEEEGVVHLSNPIRLKQDTKPTEYLPQNVSIDTIGSMPLFSWQDGAYDDTVIYFHVVSDKNDNLLSGTYTDERFFRYYKLDNVVLNITRESPPLLEFDRLYNFSLLAVSEDNWVNLFSEVRFEIK